MPKVQTKMLNMSLDITLFFFLRKYEKLPLSSSFHVMLYPFLRMSSDHRDEERNILSNYLCPLQEL